MTALSGSLATPTSRWRQRLPAPAAGRGLARWLAWALLALAALPARGAMVYHLAAAPEARIQSAVRSAETLREFLYSGTGGGLYLDREWHGLHWLLARDAGSTPDPLSRVVIGGREVGPKLGYGRARFFPPDEVRQIAGQLAGIDYEQLRRNYDAAAMDAAEIYPGGWAEAERRGEEPFDHLVLAFSRLRDFYQRAAAAGHAVLMAWG